MKTVIKTLSAFITRNPAAANDAMAFSSQVGQALNQVEQTIEYQLASSRKPAKLYKDFNEAAIVLTNLVYCIDVACNPAPALEELRSRIVATIAMIHHVNKNFITHVPLASPATFPVKNIMAVIEEINTRLKSCCANEMLYGLLDQHIKELKDKVSLPFHRWVWWSAFCNYAENLVQAHTLLVPGNGFDDKLIEMLLSLDFNTPGFIQFLAARMEDELALEPAVSGKVTLLHSYILDFELLQPSLLGFFSAAASLKHAMLKILYRQLNAQSLLRSSVASSGAQSDIPAKITTSLSVPQVALFIRLLLDGEIIRTDNQSALLRSLASVIQTTRAASISADSIRNKFYAPDNAAKAIVKDHLILMLNRLRQY